MRAQRPSDRRLWRFQTKTAVELCGPVLLIEGRLSHESARELEAIACRHASDATGDVTFDLSGVDYISSASLRVFQGLADRQSQKGARLWLRSPSFVARLALELSGLEVLLDSGSSKEDSTADDDQK